MLKKIATLGCLLALVSACGDSEDAKFTKVKALQKSDKNLSCREILLEMNEANFYDKMAHKNRGVKLKNVLMPLGYISTYMDAEDAIGAARARVEYLDKIYEIMRCEDQEREFEKQSSKAADRRGSNSQYSSSDSVRYYYLDK